MSVAGLQIPHQGREAAAKPLPSAGAAREENHRSLPYSTYDLEFVIGAPDAIMCGTCQRVVQEAQQATCCGRCFCRVCVDLWTGVCPTCHQPGSTLYAATRVDQQVRGLRIFCVNRQLGCTWQGEMNRLEHHLLSGNGCPLSLVDCPFKEVGCTSSSLLRGTLQQHMLERNTHHLLLVYGAFKHTQSKATSAEEKTEEMEQKVELLELNLELAESSLSEVVGKLDEAHQKVEAAETRLREVTEELSQLKMRVMYGMAAQGANLQSLALALSGHGITLPPSTLGIMGSVPVSTNSAAEATTITTTSNLASSKQLQIQAATTLQPSPVSQASPLPPTTASVAPVRAERQASVPWEGSGLFQSPEGSLDQWTSGGSDLDEDSSSQSSQPLPEEEQKPEQSTLSSHSANGVHAAIEGVKKVEGEGVRRREVEGVRRGEEEGVRRREAEGVRRGEGEGVRRGEGEGVSTARDRSTQETTGAGKSNRTKTNTNYGRGKRTDIRYSSWRGPASNYSASRRKMDFDPTSCMKLFVRHMPHYKTRTDITELFSKYGTVHFLDFRSEHRDKIYLVMDKEGGRKAISDLDGVILRGSSKGLIVQEHKPHVSPLDVVTPKEGILDGLTPAQYLRLFVKYIPYDMDEDDVYDMFSKHGRIYDIAWHPTRGNICFVYMNREGARRAMMVLHGKKVPGCHRPLIVDVSHDPR